MCPSTDTSSVPRVEPFLRWAGSKRRLIPKLARYWSSSYKRYVEPFMGSACLFFSLRPRRALLGDINADLVNCFEAVRDHPLATYRAISRIPVSEESYYRLRKTRYRESQRIERAARFIYLNRYCFNGLYRTNLRGEFNVPFSSSRNGQLPQYDYLREVSDRLRCADLMSGDFQQVLKKVKQGDFVYLDPPYVVSGRRVFKEYGPRLFDSDDLTRLSDTLFAIDSVGAHFLLSYAFCPESKEISRGWHCERVVVQRNISGFSTFRRRSVEIIVTNISEF